jgi:hypothetical protein
MNSLGEIMHGIGRWKQVIMVLNSISFIIIGNGEIG